MLQTTTAIKCAQFSKTDLADIQRGAVPTLSKQRKLDPIHALISEFWRLVPLNKARRDAMNSIRDSLPEEARGFASVRIDFDRFPMLRNEIRSTVHSAKQARHVFSDLRKRSRRLLKTYQEQRREHLNAERQNSDPARDAYNLSYRRDITASINRVKEISAVLSEARSATIQAVIDWERRIDELHESSGYKTAYELYSQSADALEKVAKRLSKTRPVTVDGALTAITFCAQMVTDDDIVDCYLPTSALQTILQNAHARLRAESGVAGHA
jgi:hypothetical protein